MSTNRRAFTVTDALTVLVVVLIIGILAATLIVGGRRGRRHYGNHPRDASSTRGLMQGFVLWAGSNQDRFPLPSLLDQSDATVAEKGEAKNTTANVFSLMIFNSFFPPEILVSTEEVNPNIQRMDDYVLHDPPSAVDPAHALWDPALRADFTGPTPGNISFAHMFPSVPQSPSDNRYGPSEVATRAVVGNRGPQITGITGSRGQMFPTYAPTPTGTSRTFLIHGTRDKWEGYIGYADNHVNFETRLDPESAPFRSADGKDHPDLLFYEEPTAQGLDNFLGIYIKAGAERKDFTTIWD